MSKLRHVSVLAACVIAVAPAHGQTHAPTDSLLRRVLLRDSIVGIHVRIVDSVRRAVARPLPPVEVAGGVLRVRTERDLEPRVRVAVDSVARLIDRRGSTTIDSRFAARVPSITWDSTRADFGASRVILLTPDTVRRWSTARLRVRDRASRAELTLALARVAEQIAFEGADSTLSAWAMSGRLPLAPVATTELSDLYTEIATTPSAALRRCRGGDDGACFDALGIDSTAGARLSRWYAPTDYRALLRIVAPPREDSAAMAAWLRCRKGRDEGACRLAAAAVPDDRLPPPLAAAARLSFLSEVLEAGGPGAYDRLVTTPGSLRTRLEAASREPAGRTVRRWLGRVERSRPERMRVSPGLALASLGWSGAFLALTLTRRYSWV